MKPLRVVHSQGLTKDYRAGRNRVKKLLDEVTPVACFVKTCAAPEDRIQLNLNNKFPDCILFQKEGPKREIEVTRAQAREGYHLATELNETGAGRGFIGVPDDASDQEFEDAMARERRAYSTEEVVTCIERAIELRAQKKRLHRGDILLIDAPLYVIPSSRWNEYSARFAKKVKALRFDEVYLTGRGDNGDICLKITP